MKRFRPNPDESPALTPPPRLPPTAVGLATLPPAVPPGDVPSRHTVRFRARLGFALAGVGLVAGGIALGELSVLLIPIGLAAGWLGAEALVVGIIGRRVRGLTLIRVA